MKNTNKNGNATKTVYGIYQNDQVMFQTLDDAENYLINNYPEYCCHKDSTIDFCERMIWEDEVKCA